MLNRMGASGFTHEKKDVYVGPLQVSHEQKSTGPISPILSAIFSLVAGVGWLWWLVADHRLASGGSDIVISGGLKGQVCEIADTKGVAKILFV
jgi:hypothetical protein